MQAPMIVGALKLPDKVLPVAGMPGRLFLRGHGGQLVNLDGVAAEGRSLLFG
jgi:hypothetical protein